MTQHSGNKEALSIALRSSGPRTLSDAERNLLYGHPCFVGLPDGRGAHLLHALEARWLTQRAPTATAERNELWVTSALAPLVTVLVERSLPLAAGGTLAMAEYHHPALIGPTGWLPSVAAGGLVALRVVHGEVEVRAVDPPVHSLPEQQRARELLGRHLRADNWYDDDDGNNRRFALTKALGSALLEDPAFLREPWPPLDELLHDPLREQHGRHWRDSAAAWQDGAVSFCIADMPGSLHGELNRRAMLYGTTFDQFVVTVLGHLAWRTPFAEDLEPWESWVPEDEPLPPPLPLRRVT